MPSDRDPTSDALSLLSYFEGSYPERFTPARVAELAAQLRRTDPGLIDVEAFARELELEARRRPSSSFDPPSSAN